MKFMSLAGHFIAAVGSGLPVGLFSAGGAHLIGTYAGLNENLATGVGLAMGVVGGVTVYRGAAIGLKQILG